MCCTNSLNGNVTLRQRAGVVVKDETVAQPDDGPMQEAHQYPLTHRRTRNLKLRRLTEKLFAVAGVVVKEETVAQLDDGPMQWKQIDNNLKIKNIKNSKYKATGKKCWLQVWW
jgi:hypothetical protein